MLNAQALTFKFRDGTAVDRLDLQVNAGEVFCLLGANGAGKSTTIKLFLGFLTPTSGLAAIDGVEVARNPIAARRKVLFIPEQVALHEELTGMENLAYFATLSAVADATPARLLECLSQAGLPTSSVHRRASTYSKGMRQKVGVALAIAKGAKVLLLDEPTSGLDPQASAEFHDLVARQRDAGAAVLMVTHDLFRAKHIADRIGIMRDGRMRPPVAAATVTAQELEATYLKVMSDA